ncbi:50S ribosomal protein L11 methyltransferase [Campylobacter showae]|uniref:Ribosomal protein L11 methyltransferase n=1 Tax=Campylobacter showae CSUNSWCD TaxID=1244083 RepID=M5ISD6_9BACT|nr:50S ribosomal protein L11 methyltransferase [Campylobacter showae]EKU12401.1 Ribosomal protein L11 methyltransferase [Campylobacter showae CSUNSWCD]
MKDKFYELEVLCSQELRELFEDLVFSLGVTCTQETAGGFIIRDEDELDEVEFGLQEYAKSLQDALGREIEFKTTKSQKENKDWLNEYKKNVRPIEIGKFYIHPSWEESKDGFENIIIDPALAFGSGHHESTSACIEYLQKYATIGKSALDVGCGSGILSIALAKLGCVVDACDTDEQAVQSSQKNAELNGVKFNQIWTGSVANLDKKYDIVVANIIADVILMLKNDLINLLKESSCLVLAGVLDKYETRILEAFSSLKLVESQTKNEWKSFVFQKA